MVDPSPEAYLASKARGGDEDALASLKAMAEKENPHAQYLLGYRLAGNKTDCVEGMNWLRRAGNHGHADAQRFLAGIYGRGCGQIPPNYEEGYYWELVTQKTNQNYPFLVGYLHSDYSPNDYGIPGSLKFFESKLTADQISIVKNRVSKWEPNITQPLEVAFAAALEMGRDTFKAGGYESSRRYLGPLVQRGIPEAQFLIGTEYLGGLGIKQDAAVGLDLIRKAADQGYGPALLQMGKFYRSCSASDKSNTCFVIPHHDNAEALKWFQKASDKGIPEAEFEIGNLYWTGDATLPKNEEQALVWWQKAGDHGFVSAQYELGQYYRGRLNDAKPNLSEASKWYHLAAEQDFDPAMKELAWMYATGQGVNEDIVESFVWANINPSGSYASPGGGNLYDQMTSEQVGEAERRIAEWRSSHHLPVATVNYQDLRPKQRDWWPFHRNQMKHNQLRAGGNTSLRSRTDAQKAPP